MSLLIRIDPNAPDALWGAADIYEADPPVEVHRNVYYLPWQPHGCWGIFDRDDKAIMSAIDFALPTFQTISQPLNTYMRHSEMGGRAPDRRYIYGGRFSPHFGHFLVEALPRFWHLGERSFEGRDWMGRARPRPKILVHGDASGNFFEDYPFAPVLYSALGLRAEDFVFFDRPLKVRELIVPMPSLHQQSSASRAYGRMGRRIGEVLLAGRRPRPDDRPVWLSKSRLTGGVRRFVNEAEIEAELVRHGVEIVYPETLPLADQVLLFASRTRIMGTAGSAFHVGVFAPMLGRQVVLSNGPVLNAGWVMFDRLSGADSSYHLAPGTTEVGGKDFLVEVHVPEPEQVARDLLDAVLNTQGDAGRTRAHMDAT